MLPESNSDAPLSRERFARLPGEIANAVTHGIGLVLSIVGAVVLIMLAVRFGTARHVAGAAIFGATLVLLYAASTCYHAVCRVRLKERLRLLDHLAILYLIAGSYTPYAIVMARPWGLAMLAAVWAMALGGTVFKLVSKRRFDDRMTWIYIAMGWVSLAFAKPLIEALPAGGLGWLAAGGLLYTGGVFFYLRDRPRFDHAVWHLFVLGGSVCHYVSVFRYVMPWP